MVPPYQGFFSIEITLFLILNIIVIFEMILINIGDKVMSWISNESEETRNTEEVSVTVEEKVDSYVGDKNNALRDEFDDAKKAYKIAKTKCSSSAERKQVMEAFMDDCIDIAVEAKATDDWEFKREMDHFIDSLAKRTYRPKRSRY